MISQFDTFIKKFHDWKQKLDVYQRDDVRYQRVKIDYTFDGEDITHHYHACIDTNSGDIYLDCRRRKIMAKHIALFMIRPIHTAIKTLWHATILPPLILEFVEVLQKRQTKRALVKNTKTSLKNIVRTPLYGIAITITHLAGIIFGCFVPNTLYHTRALAGRLERCLLNVQNVSDDNDWELSPCFWPIVNLLENSPPIDLLENVEGTLEKFAKKQIKFRRKYSILWNDCFQRLPVEKAYVSAAAKK